jgi:hypothetical protein
MDEQWGPRMAFARRRYFVLCTPASVLRFSFSEDRASELKSEYWCGAAKRSVVHCAAKSAFSILHHPSAQPKRSQSANLYVQVVDVIELMFVKMAPEARESTRKCQLYRH